MSVLDTELVPVHLGFCPCKDTPHDDGDIVFLYPALPAPAGVRARSFFTAGMTGELDATTVEERIAELWLSMCVAEWTFVFDDGSPIPVTPENVLRALPYGKGGREVADKADDLYVESVTAPLVARLTSLSQRGKTSNGRPATSRRPSSTRKPRKPSLTATTDKVPPVA